MVYEWALWRKGVKKEVFKGVLAIDGWDFLKILKKILNFFEEMTI